MESHKINIQKKFISLRDIGRALHFHMNQLYVSISLVIFNIIWQNTNGLLGLGKVK